MRRLTNQPGVTLIEVAVSTALVGLVLVAALETLGGAMRSMRETQDETRAHTLAETLMAEVIALPYSDPDGDSSGIGLEVGESAVGGDRTQFDDVDDFHGRANTPPENRDGTAMTDYAEWTRSVEVIYLAAEPVSNALTTNNTDQGLKRVRVAVTDPSGVATELFAIRSPDGPNEAPAPFDATRVGRMQTEVQVGGAGTIRKAVALTNLAEDPNP